jgi:hypothetical protein
MVKNKCLPYSRNPRRAALKMAVIAGVLLLFVGLLSLTVNQAALNQLKFDLSLWTVIALVLIINLLSAACFIILYIAYRWVRCDLKPPRSEDMPDQDPSAL